MGDETPNDSIGPWPPSPDVGPWQSGEEESPPTFKPAWAQHVNTLLTD
jgi:hypothetical protein